MVKLWVLADKLLLPSLQNLIIDALETLRKDSGKTPTLCIRYFCKNTAKDSAIRRFFVALCAGHLKPECILDNLFQYPPDFLAEIVIVLRKKLPSVCSQQLMPGHDISRYKVLEN